MDVSMSGGRVTDPQGHAAAAQADLRAIAATERSFDRQLTAVDPR
jgi:hypothetical protein